MKSDIQIVTIIKNGAYFIAVKAAMAKCDPRRLDSNYTVFSNLSMHIDDKVSRKLNDDLKTICDRITQSVINSGNINVL